VVLEGVEVAAIDGAAKAGVHATRTATSEIAVVRLMRTASLPVVTTGFLPFTPNPVPRRTSGRCPEHGSSIEI